MGEMLTYIFSSLRSSEKDWMLLQGQSVNSGASINRLQSLLP